jgi:hypothetical protein
MSSWRAACRAFTERDAAAIVADSIKAYESPRRSTFANEEILTGILAHGALVVFASIFAGGMLIEEV